MIELGRNSFGLWRMVFPPLVITLLLLPQLCRAQDNSFVEAAVTSDIDIQGANVWLATSNGADYSHDLGMTWVHYGAGNGLGEGGVCGLSVSNNLIVIATSLVDSNYSIPMGTGLSFSTSNGTSWTHVPQPIDSSGDTILSYGINDSLRILPIHTSQYNLAYDVAQQNDTVWIASYVAGLRKTTDNGQHWQRVLLPLDDMYHLSPTDTLRTKNFDPRLNLNLLVFSVAVENDSILWCGTAGGINKSTDRGLSWSRYTAQLNGLTGNWGVALHGQTTPQKHVVWASTWPANDPSERIGISFSSDGGATWQTALSGRKSWNISSQGDTVMVPTDNGLYRSVDGHSWEYFQPLGHDTLYDAVKDSYGGLWVATPHGNEVFSDRAELWSDTTVVSVKREEARPLKYRLGQNYPNPFNPSTTISFTVPRFSHVTLSVYTILGQLVQTVVNENKAPGVYHVQVDGSRWGTGVYFYRLSAGNFVQTRKMALVQ